MLDNERARSAASVIVDPIAKVLLWMHITPSMITVFGAVATTTVAITCIAQGRYLLGAILTFLFAGADAVDGTMARLSNSQSRWGSFLDSALDRITDGAVFAAVVWCFVSDDNTAAAIAALIALIAGFVTSYVRAKAESLGVECKVGVAERPERVGGVMLGLFLAGIGFEVMLPVLIYLVAVLSTITVIQRFVVVRKALS